LLLVLLIGHSEVRSKQKKSRQTGKGLGSGMVDGGHRRP
jgi:hypothetical protein